MEHKCAVIIPAAGNSSRMSGACENKIFLNLGDIPLIAMTMKAFENSSAISAIVVVAKENEFDLIKNIAIKYGISKFTDVVKGGKTRQQSVLNGIKTLEKNSINFSHVAIHDGARPFIKPSQIDDIVSAAYEFSAAACAYPVSDTVKTVDSNGFIANTLDRRIIWTVQTPQCFDLPLYKNAIEKAIINGMDFTDDCQLFEYISTPVKLVDCGDMNFKITRPEDIEKANIYVKYRKYEENMMRIGHGYDVHRLENNRKLILGGVNIDYHLGLLGHSDADVLTHAIMDALLGAAALGDIGRHFPDSYDKYKDISSLVLLKEVKVLLDNESFYISNIDSTIVAQKPKLAQYIGEIVENIANTLDLDASCVNVKATTEEGLGFTGCGEGISAHAVAMICKK